MHACCPLGSEVSLNAELRRGQAAAAEVFFSSSAGGGRSVKLVGGLGRWLGRRLRGICAMHDINGISADLCKATLLEELVTDLCRASDFNGITAEFCRASITAISAFAIGETSAID